MVARKVDALMYGAEQKGLKLLSFEVIGTNFRIRYLDSVKGGLLPVLQDCRDELDFSYKMDAWMKRATVYSKEYSDFETLVAEEIKRLNKQ